jgi:hypothetical protein
MRNFLRNHRRRWVARAFGRNPLLRWTDRAEACIVIAAVLLAIAAGPVCIADGVEVYRSHGQIYGMQSQTRHLVTATVAASGHAHTPHSTTTSILAVWTEGADGARGGDVRSSHADWTRTQRAVEDGDQIQLWIDDNGRLVDPPTPLMQAGVDGIGVAGGIWGAVVLGLIAIVGVLRSPLDQIRQKQLSGECERFASGGMPNRSP